MYLMLYMYCILILIIIGIGFPIAYLVFKQINISKQRKINKGILISLKECNFDYSKIVFLADSNTYNRANNCKKMIILDNVNSKICFVDYETKKPLIVDYKDILNYEIYDNTQISTSGSDLGTGKIKKSGKFKSFSINESVTVERCKELRLIIRLKNNSSYQTTYDLSKTFLNIGMDKSRKKYKICIRSLQEVVSILEVLLSESK